MESYTSVSAVTFRTELIYSLLKKQHMWPEMSNNTESVRKRLKSRIWCKSLDEAHMGLSIYL